MDGSGQAYVTGFTISNDCPAQGNGLHHTEWADKDVSTVNRTKFHLTKAPYVRVMLLRLECGLRLMRTFSGLGGLPIFQAAQC